MEQDSGGDAVRVTPEPVNWPRAMQSTQVSGNDDHPVIVVHPPGVTPVIPGPCPDTCWHCHGNGKRP